MTWTVNQICNFMEDWAPPGLAYPWDKVGLHTGNPADEVRAVLVCLTVTPEVVKAAGKVGANIIIAHHPLIWEPITSLRGDNSATELCLRLVLENISCFVAHTNLDIAPGGVNDALADCLGLHDRRPLFQAEHIQAVKLVTFIPPDHVDALRDALAAAGAGGIGNYTHCSFHTEGTGCFKPNEKANPYAGKTGVLAREEELRFEMLLDGSRLKPVLKALFDAHPYEEPAYDLIALENKNTGLGLGVLGTLPEPMLLNNFAKWVRRRLNLPYLLTYGEPNRIVRVVGAVGGSGGSLLKTLPPDADVFVSGDIDYHTAQGALLRGTVCIDAGHAGTELPVLQKVQERLQAHFSGLPVHTCEEQPIGMIHC